MRVDGGLTVRLSPLPLTSLEEMFVCSEEFRSQPAYQALVGHDHQVELELVELDRRKMWVDPTVLLVAPLLGGPAGNPMSARPWNGCWSQAGR
jgi:hypothetical protein